MTATHKLNIKPYGLPDGSAYSRRFVRPSQFCPEHISKSIEGNVMKLDTLTEGHEENCRMQEP